VNVRRVRHGEWLRVRALRLAALQDPDAGIAFLDTYAHAAAQPTAFWIKRTDDAAGGRRVAQFIAEAGDEWVGSLTVIVRPADAHAEEPDVLRADVVGVFVAPTHRGDGTVDGLFAAAARWAAKAGATYLSLDVHADNHRAQGAYRRAGFAPTGESFTGPIGPEIVMARSLTA
jgi:ribosomal protein S18 acetylase RimI-like enzyme